MSHGVIGSIVNCQSITLKCDWATRNLCFRGH